MTALPPGHDGAAQGGPVPGPDFSALSGAEPEQDQDVDVHASVAEHLRGDGYDLRFDESGFTHTDPESETILHAPAPSFADGSDSVAHALFVAHGEEAGFVIEGLEVEADHLPSPEETELTAGEIRAHQILENIQRSTAEEEAERRYEARTWEERMYFNSGGTPIWERSG